MATLTWVAGTSANWDTPADWSTAALPGTTDIATISQPGAGAYTVSEDITALINGLTVGNGNATLAFNTASQTLTVKGATALPAGTVNVSTTGTLATDTFTQTGGSLIESAGLLSVTGTGAAFSVTGIGSSFNLSGGAVVVANGASLAGVSDTISGGSFNAGTLALGGTPTTLSGGTLTSSGATALTNGTVLIQSAGTLSTASLAVSGGTFTESGGQVTATGAATFTGGSDTITGGAFNAGALTIGGAGNLGLSSGGSIVINSGGGNVGLAGGGKISMGLGTGQAVLDATNGGIADNGSIISFGTVKGVLSGGGNVEAHNGLLDLTGNIGSSTGLAFQINGGSLSDMQLDGTVGSANTFKFLPSDGVLDLAWIYGWAQNSDNPEAPVCVDVFENDVLIARTLANRYRPDLKMAALGSGRHAFEVRLLASLCPQSRHVIQVRRSSDGTLLGSACAVETSESTNALTQIAA